MKANITARKAILLPERPFYCQKSIKNGESPVFLIYILIPQAKSGDILLTAALLKYL